MDCHSSLNLAIIPKADPMTTIRSYLVRTFFSLVICALLALPVAAADKPVKVFILVGQSNMEGHAKIETFDYIGDDPKTAPLLKKMRNADGEPRVCDGAWISDYTGQDEENGEGFGKLTTGYASRPDPSEDGGLSAHGRGGKPHTHNKPLSSGKGSAHEGGVRVPMIVAWPGVTQADSVCQHPVIMEDFFPSILEMAGVSSVEQSGSVINGRSFVNLLRSEQDVSREDRPLIWHFPNNWGPRGPGIGPSSAIRLGDWKLIYDHQWQQHEFNLIEDSGDQNNLAEKQTDMRDRLARELREYLASVRAQMPIVTDSGETVRYPGSVVPAGKDR